jgi:hypothetical protein
MLPAILTHLSVGENSWRKPCVECALRKSVLKSPQKYILWGRCSSWNANFAALCLMQWQNGYNKD